jgi:hypothetical protein
MLNAEKLKNRDYVLVIDKSASMEETDTKAGVSRWEEAKETTIALARKMSEFDPDGITVYTFGSSFKKYENVTEAKVKDIFMENSPGGSTILAPVLQDIFADYKKRKAAGSTKANGEVLMVVTDGAPQDGSEAQKAIINFGNNLSNADDEYGIGFFQIGKDPQATKYLKNLDDGLVPAGAKYDIVDTKTVEEIENIGITEALLQALSD